MFELFVGELRLEGQGLKQLHLLGKLLILYLQYFIIIFQLFVAQAESADGLLKLLDFTEEQQGHIRRRCNNFIIGKLEFAL